MRLRLTFLHRALPISLLLAAAIDSAAVAQGCAFREDFESGSLANWTLGGRRQGTWTVDVVARGGNLVGHLYHADFTEVRLERRFAYDPTLTLSFDMETRIAGTASSTSDFYQVAGFGILFHDAGGTVIGSVRHWASTSSFPFTCCPDPRNVRVRISAGGPRPYSFPIGSLLAMTTVAPGQVAAVTLQFESYASGWPYSMSGDVWFDNVHVGGVVADLMAHPRPLLAGNYCTLTVRSGKIYEPVFLVISAAGPGSFPVPPLGITLDVLAPVVFPLALVTNHEGRADWVFPLPPALRGAALWWQTAQLRCKSTVVATQVM